MNATGKTFDCSVVTPEGPVFDGKVEFAVVPGHDGEVGFLPGHADYIGALGHGEMRLILPPDDRLVFYVVLSGFAQIKGGKLTVLATECHSEDKVDMDHVEHELKMVKRIPMLHEEEVKQRDQAIRRAHALKQQTVRRTKRKSEK